MVMMMMMMVVSQPRYQTLPFLTTKPNVLVLLTLSAKGYSIPNVVLKITKMGYVDFKIPEMQCTE